LENKDAWEMVTFDTDEEAPISYMPSAETPRAPE
jgi:UDP-3-O-[3-hydroxymyristoyl] N-acetylglucosamine deacetylase